ncbi:hypothetical protein REPUB_Repub07fG0202500 [Reevesia pubescens]
MKMENRSNLHPKKRNLMRPLILMKWEEEIERELAKVTFEELQKARANGTDLVSRKPHSENKHRRRANKNRPMELSSKKPVRSFRQVIQASKKVARDPHFESSCGKLDVDGFRKRYNFLFENNLPAEREDKQLKFESAKHTDAVILAQHKKRKRSSKAGETPFLS